MLLDKIRTNYGSKTSCSICSTHNWWLGGGDEANTSSIRDLYLHSTIKAVVENKILCQWPTSSHYQSGPNAARQIMLVAWTLPRMLSWCHAHCKPLDGHGCHLLLQWSITTTFANSSHSQIWFLQKSHTKLFPSILSVAPGLVHAHVNSSLSAYLSPSTIIMVPAPLWEKCWSSLARNCLQD